MSHRHNYPFTSNKKGDCPIKCRSLQFPSDAHQPTTIFQSNDNQLIEDPEEPSHVNEEKEYQKYQY